MSNPVRGRLNAGFFRVDRGPLPRRRAGGVAVLFLATGMVLPG